jgi:hypothetical protein
MSALWPLEEPKHDPYGDLHWEVLGLGYRDYLASEGELARAAYEALAQEYDDRVCAGQTELPDALIEQLRLRPSILLNPVSPNEPYSPIDTEELARLATDFQPALGQDAPDLIYGPFCDEMDANQPPDRALLLRAIALAGMEHIQGSPFSGAEMWARSHITPSVEDRARVRMISDVPVSLWRIESQRDAHATLADQLGLRAEFLPDRPVLLADCMSVTKAQATHLIARVGRTPSGWTAHFPLTLPSIPPLEAINQWLRTELLRARLRVRRITLERLLKRRGHVLIRRLHEYLWLRQEQALDV